MTPSVSDYGASTSSRRLERNRRPSIGSSKSSGSKGKGRAIDDEDEQDGEDRDGGEEAELETVKGMSFSIRFTDGTTEDLIDIYVNNGEAIRDVKRRVRVGSVTFASTPNSADNGSPCIYRYVYCVQA